MAMFLVLLEVSFVDNVAASVVLALALHHVVLPLSFVEVAVPKYLLALAVPLLAP